MISGALREFGAHPPPVDPRALARTILSQRRFQIHVTRPPERTWWDVILQWLSDRWNQLVQALAQHVHLGGKADVVFGDLLVLAAIVLVVAAGIRLMLGIVRERDESVRTARPFERRASAAELYARSLQAAEAGSAALAVTLLFQAALARLDMSGLLRDDPSKTVNECLRAVAERAPACRAQFECIARLFTGALYGGAAISPDEWAAARGAYDALAPEASRDAA